MSKLKYYNGSTWKTVNGEITGDTLPIGSIVEYGSLNAPTNWLICDGSAVSRTDYAELFAVIGTSFGSGNGSTTFNLPDFRMRVPAGYKSSDSDFNAIGKTGGNKQHKHLTALGFDSTYLYGYAGSDTNPAYGSEVVYNIKRNALSGFNQADNEPARLAYTAEDSSLQPYLTVRFIIKAKQSAGLVANVSNIQSDSTTDTYSCDYVNDTIDGIIESGTANGGTYIKFFDGTLICRGSIGPITTNAGTGADLTITLPYNFKDRWFDLTASIVDGQAYWGQIQFSFITLSGSQFKFVVWNNSGGINANQYFSYIAIGRWK